MEDLEIAGITYVFNRLDTDRQLPPFSRPAKNGKDMVIISFSPPHIYRSENGNEISIIPEVTRSRRRIK